MRKLSLFALGTVFATAVVVSTACDDDDDDFFEETEARQDCREACSDWEECVGDDRVDVDSCTDLCVARLDVGEFTERAVERCSDCLDAASANTCSTACDAECDGIFEGFVQPDAGLPKLDGGIPDGALVRPDAGFVGVDVGVREDLDDDLDEELDEARRRRPRL